MSERSIEVGRVGAPNGVRGWVKVQSFTEPAEHLFSQREWQVRFESGAHATLQLAEWRVHGDAWIAKFQSVDDRNAAQRLTGAWIEWSRDQLPPTREREYYLADLVGLAVKNLEGAELGVIDHFVAAPGNDVMVVKGTREHWVPVTKQHLQRVDLAARVAVVDWPADF
jgi:16S rRNA processing protein RimM